MREDWVKATISKHASRGVVLDTNLYLLFIAGSCDEELIGKWKRLESFVPDDFKILRDFLKPFHKIIVSPHILTEVSNLSKKVPTDYAKYLKSFIGFSEKTNEKNVEKSIVLKNKFFSKIQFADAAIFEIAKSHGCLVLTDDFPLSAIMQSQNMPVINFNNIRTPVLLSRV